MVDDRDAVAQALRFFHVVRRQEHRDAPRVHAFDRLPQREAALRVEARGRLVEEEHRRVVRDRARNLNALRHAARELVRESAGALAQPEIGEQLVGAHPRVLRMEAEVHPMHREVLADGERAIERAELRHDADRALHRRRVGAHVDPIHGYASRRRFHAGRADAHRRRLACAVRSEQPEDLATAHLEVDPLQCVHFAASARVDLGQLLDDDACGFHGPYYPMDPWRTSDCARPEEPIATIFNVPNPP